MKICRIDNCTRVVERKDLCSAHYQRLKKGISLEKPLRVKPIGKCSIAGCERPDKVRRLCDLHYGKLLKYGDPTVAKQRSPSRGAPCEAESCTRKQHARGLCVMHYGRWEKHGDVTKVSCIKTHGDTCTREDCSEPYYCLGECRKHYTESYKKRNWEVISKRDKEKGARPDVRYRHLQRSAQKRNLEMTISFEEHKELLLKPCHYCGSQLNSSGSGLDRIDSKLGYTITNVVACCKLCNQAKMDLNQPQFIEHILKIAKLHGK